MISHHAVLLSVDSPLTCALEEWNHVPTTDRYQLAQIGIDDVRTLIAHAHRRPDGDAAMRTIIVATEFITEEAQQALLKIIEEPPLSTSFVFVIPNGYTFLPTLESRFERRLQTNKEVENVTFKAFLAAGYRERMGLIEDAVKRKDHAWYQDVKNGLALYLTKHAATLEKQALIELEYVLRLLLTRGASNKFLVEHLALTLPA